MDQDYLNADNKSDMHADEFHLKEFSKTCFGSSAIYCFFALIEILLILKYRERYARFYYRNKSRLYAASFASLLKAVFFVACGLFPNGYSFFFDNHIYGVLLLTLFFHICQFCLTFAITIDNTERSSFHDLSGPVLVVYGTTEALFLLLAFLISRNVAEIIRDVFVFAVLAIALTFGVVDQVRCLSQCLSGRSAFDGEYVYQESMTIAFELIHAFTQFASLIPLFTGYDTNIVFSITTSLKYASEGIPYFIFAILFFIEAIIFG